MLGYWTLARKKKRYSHLRRNNQQTQFKINALFIFDCYAWLYCKKGKVNKCNHSVFIYAIQITDVCEHIGLL